MTNVGVQFDSSRLWSFGSALSAVKYRVSDELNSRPLSPNDKVRGWYLSTAVMVSSALVVIVK